MIESIPVTDPVKLHGQMRDGRPIHLVDVRSPAEYADGHAAGALSVPTKEKEKAHDFSTTV
jgi:rhodanese-related sulfurtransferase